uniref:TGF-beta family profile domain-containing protein n=1 Tax=Leptobrachium leishanense TaxID=445787 RepID=A0A8C5WGZ5_9ANUR
MTELYNQVADKDGITKAPGFLQGNVVRSFENKVNSDPDHPYIFNISSVGTHEKLLKAELRVFKWKALSSPERHHFCRVDVYKISDSASRPWRVNLIASRYLSLHFHGWEMFNVTLTISKWVGDNNTNHGFLVTYTLPNGEVIDEEHLGSKKHQPKTRRSYLVIHSDDGRRGIPNSTIIHPNLKNTDSSVMPSKPQYSMQPLAHRYPRAVDRLKTRHGRETQIQNEPDPPCKRKPMYVDFEEIGWDGWIIFPKGYNAYFCKGTCPFPLGQDMGATNHATVQSIMYILKLNKEVEKPCCVPNKLNSINLLYFDEEENVVLKQYNDMIAESCGCL